LGRWEALMESRNGFVDPASHYFKMCCVIADIRIEHGLEPDWFREHFEKAQDIARDFALPPRFPLTLALALDLAFELPTPAALKRFKQSIDDALTHLGRARPNIVALRDFSLTLLTLDCLEQTKMPDGGVILRLGPDPFEKILQGIDTFMQKLSNAEVGRRTSPVRCAVSHLDRFVNQHNPELSAGRREDLCHYLFDPARKRDDHRSRSPDRDQDEMPRYRDIDRADRTARRRRPAGTRSRKIGKKVC
jgi:hypothetical protein